MNETSFPNFSISPEIIDKITWDKPSLNFGIPRKRMKEITNKYTKKTSIEQGNFGSISTIIQAGGTKQIITFNENISSGLCRVFVNLESNEVIKFLDNKIYAHFDSSNNSPLMPSQISISSDIFKQHNIDIDAIDLNTFQVPSLPSFSRNIDDDIEEFDDYNNDLEQLLNTPLEPCPVVPIRTYPQKTVITSNLVSKNKSMSTSDDADESDFADNENPEENAYVINHEDNSAPRSSVMHTIDHTAPTEINKPAVSTMNSQQIHNRFQFPQTVQSYNSFKKQGVSEMKIEMISLKMKMQNQDMLITNLQNQNHFLTEMINQQKQAIKNYNELEERLKQEIENLKLNNILYKKQVEVLQGDKTQLIQKLNQLSKTNHNKLLAKDDILSYFNKQKPDTISDLGWHILSELFKNAHFKKEGRYYSEETKKFFWVINSQSASAFETLHSVLPTPCYNTIHNSLKKTVMKAECSLLDIKYAAKFSDDFLSHYTNSVIKATLAVDAIVVTPSTIEAIKKQYSASSPTLNRAFNTQLAFKDDFQSVLKGVFDDKPCSEREKNEVKDMKHKQSTQDDETNKKEKPLNNVFVFYVEPIDPEIPCYPVHIYLQAGGSANEVVRTLTEHVVAQVQQNGKCIITDISTDGDTGHQEEYQKALMSILSISPELNIEEICEALRKFKCPTLAAADMLHFIKTMRARILLNMLTLFPDKLSVIFHFSELGPIFGEGHEITDLSQIGKMRDVYPILFFSLENLNILIKQNMWNAIIMFMPWSLWVAATMNTGFTNEARLLLLKICFEFIKRFYNIISSDKKWDSDVGSINRDKEFLTILSRSVLERLVITLVVIIFEFENFMIVDAAYKEWNEAKEKMKEVKDKQEAYELQKEIKRLRNQFNSIAKQFGYPEDSKPDFAFDRLGTHPLENFNGNIRDIAHANDTISSTSHIIARAYVQKLLKNELGIPNVRKKRINAGGIRLSNSINCIGTPSTEINPVVLVESIFAMSNAATEETIMNFELSNESINEFVQYLQECEKISAEKKCNPKFSIPYVSRNAGINDRNVMYSQIKDEE